MPRGRAEGREQHDEQMAALAEVRRVLGSGGAIALVALAQLMDSYAFAAADGAPAKAKHAKLGVPGAFGAVYRMRHKLDGALYAVKCVNVERAAQLGVDVAGMRKEATLMLALNHPRIVRFFVSCVWERADMDGDTVQEYCLVMELVAGGTLAARIATGVALAPALLLKWALQLADALHYMHAERRTLHRGLKPHGASTTGCRSHCDRAQ